MRDQSKNWFIATTLIIVMIFGSGCNTKLGEAKEIEKNDEYQSFSFNSGSILEALNKGDTDVFTLLQLTPQVTISPSTKLVEWNQSDYLRVAQALHQQTRQEPLGQQNLFAISFTIDCSELDDGTFSEATFSSFKVIGTGDDESRIEYSIVIRPSENLIRTYKGEFSPNIKTKEPINLLKFKISVGDALKIAENNGGAETRLKYKNNCVVYIRAPESGAAGWEASYSNNRDGVWQTIFDIAIDSETGNANVLYPKK